MLGEGGTDIGVPAITYDELRRELGTVWKQPSSSPDLPRVQRSDRLFSDGSLVRVGNAAAEAQLDGYVLRLRHAEVTTPILVRASNLWAEVRRRGRPTADDRALELIDSSDDVTVATANTRHIGLFVPSALWSEMRP
jgi:hypothetical protein